MKTTLFYWVFTRAPYHFIGTLFFAAWAYLSGGPWGTGTGVFLTLVHGLIWYKEDQHRERVRDLIRARVKGAESQWWIAGRPWMMPLDTEGMDARNCYLLYKWPAQSAALSRPDLWGEWTLNVYNGETDRPFATGNNDLWPRWVFEPVKG